ncbi:MAG: AMP-binding protein [Paracoccaceae bacterium]
MSALKRPWYNLYADGVDPEFVPETTTINALMRVAFERFHDLPMFEYYGQEFSYGDIRDKAAQVAAALKAEGIERGDRVALHLPNSPWHPIFFFGALTAGAAVTHLSPLDAERELQHKLEDSGAKLVVSLSTPEFANRFKLLIAEKHCPKVVLCPDFVSAAGRDCPIFEGCVGAEAFLAGFEGAPYAPVDMRPDEIALLQFTGGTTGVPKAAMLTHDNLAASVQIYCEASKNEVASRTGQSGLFYSPLFHIMGLSAGMLKRANEGGMMRLRLRFDAASAVDEIEKHGVSSLGGVPTTWIAIMQIPDIEKRDLSSLEYIASGGAPLPVEVYNRIKQLTGRKLRGGWGMTETSPAGTSVPMNMPDEKLGTIGIPLPGLDIKIVDVEDPTREMPIGEAGEMIIKGPNVTKGYWKRPEASAECFVGGYFLTGDIGYMDAEGWFYIVDRKKDMILSGGFNVYPLVIENAVHEHPDVAEAIAIGVHDEYRGESAKVFVVLNQGAAEFSLAELQAFLADKLGRHEIPRHLEFRKELPHTAVGKPSRKDLKAEEEARLVNV